MDKYAVVTSGVDGEKTASDNSRCPMCGQMAESHGEVMLCPTHGSLGYENLSSNKDYGKGDRGDKPLLGKR